MSQVKYILKEFQKAIHLHKGKDVVNLDTRVRMDFDFAIERLENIYKTGVRAVPPNKWSYHRFGLITEGAVEFNSGSSRFKALRNSLVVIPSHMITSSKNWSHNIRGFIILVNNNFFIKQGLPAKSIKNKRILSAAIRPHIILEEEQTQKLREIFESIEVESKRFPGEPRELLAVKCMELIIQAERLFVEKQHLENVRPVMDIATKFMDQVERNFMEERSVGFYADKLNMHPNSLNALVKKQTGFTAKESIQNRLIMEIKYLLHTTSLNIKEISSRLSFNDPNYFTTFFSKAEKISPARYRASFI
jgi:AraC-like DNA-binding protein